MRPRPIIFGFIVAIGITLTLAHFAFGAARSGRFKASRIHRSFGAAHSFSLGTFKSPNIHRQPSFLRPFHDLDSSGRFRASGFHRQISFHTLSTALDLLVWAESTSSQSSLFSSFSIRQSPNLEDLPQTEFTFSHVGWTAGMECRSCRQDTGRTRSKRQSVDR